MLRHLFRLMMDDKLVDYFATLELAVKFGKQVNVNRYRSSEGRKKKQKIKIFHDAMTESQLVYEGR